jgi:hypothetical protein
MLQDSSSTAWDPREMPAEPNAVFKIYVLFLLAILFVALVKMLLVWRFAPPFQKAIRRDSPAYLVLLKSTVESLVDFCFHKSL